MQNIKTSNTKTSWSHYLFISHNKLMTEMYHNCTRTHTGIRPAVKMAFKITTSGYSEMALLQHDITLK